MFKLFFIFIIASFISIPCISQDGGGKSDVPKHEKSFKSKRKLAKADRKAAREKRKEEKAERKKIRDHHKRIQTKEVRKRMKRNKGKAIRNNTHQREPFFQRLFQKKRGKASKRAKEKPSKVQQY
ncbi:MAG: hypothetical protein IPL10_18890 [Bacteroidetes bacterium]|jgi:hypothetical protein|nr:hypothetical protein [Bacteroidota bacterium]